MFQSYLNRNRKNNSLFAVNNQVKDNNHYNMSLISFIALYFYISDS